MDKTEDFDLLELQPLALTHKVRKRQKTLEEKQMIVKVTTQHPSENFSLIIHKLAFAGIPHFHELSED